MNLKEKLPSSVFRGLIGDTAIPIHWQLKAGESPLHRAQLLAFMSSPSAEWELLGFLRKEKVPRLLANKVLEVAGVPISIPKEAMKILRLGEEEASPLDFNVFWEPITNVDGCVGNWGRNDNPVIAYSLSNGSWEEGECTY